MTPVLKLAAKAARRFYYDAFLAPRGYGRPVARATWDSQYQQGEWDRLGSIDELAHYMVIVGYVRYLFESPSILDVGCGSGRLAQLLSPVPFENYLGVDISSAAIDKACALEVSKSKFETADLETWSPDRKFDAIVFNESLYYARRPVDVLLRYFDSLAADGALIVSLCRYGNHGIIWQNVAKSLSILDSTTVENSKGQVWDIKVLIRE